MKLKKIKIFYVINLLLWLAFLWIDRIWYDVLYNGVVEKQGTLGELAGPVSFFRPVILYSALTLAVILLFSLFIATSGRPEKSDKN